MCTMLRVMWIQGGGRGSTPCTLAQHNVLAQLAADHNVREVEVEAVRLAAVAHLGALVAGPDILAAEHEADDVGVAVGIAPGERGPDAAPHAPAHAVALHGDLGPFLEVPATGIAVRGPAAVSKREPHTASVLCGIVCGDSSDSSGFQGSDCALRVARHSRCVRGGACGGRGVCRAQGQPRGGALGQNHDQMLDVLERGFTRDGPLRRAQNLLRAALSLFLLLAVTPLDGHSAQQFAQRLGHALRHASAALSQSDRLGSCEWSRSCTVRHNCGWRTPRQNCGERRRRGGGQQ